MVAEQREHAPIALSALRLDGGTQPRERFDEEILREYAERMELDDRGLVIDPSHQIWEPIVVVEDGSELWLADGFHRVRAARSRDLETFQARVLVGTRRDAIKYSLSANARHGLRRSSADKRRAVQRALEDEQWRGLSARALAQLCAVSDFTIRKVRGELEERGELKPAGERLGADGKLHDVSTRQSGVRSGPGRVSASKRSGRLSGARQTGRLAPWPLEDAGRLSASLGAAHLEFSQLDGAAPSARCDLVVALARSVSDFDALSDHIARLLAPGGALLVPMAQGRLGVIGPARLERAGLPAPRWVVAQREEIVALLWTEAQRELPPFVDGLEALRVSSSLGSGELLVLGARKAS